jgi:RNA polymerase sigma-70 factor (ECF subfamily)
MMIRGSLDSDTHLMLQAQREDYESFSVLVEKYRELVLAHLSRLTQNRAVAEELAQDVFLRVYRRRHSYQPSAKFGTWLFRITRNVALNYFRDEHHELQNVSLNQPTSTGKPFECPDRRRSIEELLLLEVRKSAIQTALQELPDRQRAMIIMHKYEDMDYREIAIAVGMSHSAVKAAMFRSYERLRSALACLPVRPSKHLPV